MYMWLVLGGARFFLGLATFVGCVWNIPGVLSLTQRDPGLLKLVRERESIYVVEYTYLPGWNSDLKQEGC